MTFPVYEDKSASFADRCRDAAERARKQDPTLVGREVTIQDSELKGFHLRVTKNGALSFRYRYRRASEGKEACVTLGAYGTITLVQARKMAREKASEVALGLDPARARDVERQAPTVAEVWGMYASAILSKKKTSTQALNHGIWLNSLAPHVGNTKIKNLTISDVEKMHRSVTEQRQQLWPTGRSSDRATWSPEERKTWRRRGGPVAANHARSLLSALCNFAAKRSLCATNPCSAVEKNKQTPKDVRFATEELMLIAAALLHEPDPAVRLAFRFFLETAARHDNVCQLEWSELVGLDSDEPIWRIPAPKMKGGKPYEAHLSLDLAKAIKDYQREAPILSTKWAFPGGYSRIKGATHRDKPRGSFDSAWERVRGRALEMAGPRAAHLSGLQNGTIHTFKHTYLSRIADLGATASDIQTIGAHADIKTSMGYVHRARESVRALSQKASGELSDIWSAASQQLQPTTTVFSIKGSPQTSA